MAINNKYIFKSERLGFRDWLETDIELMAEINSDPAVMEFFPEIPDKSQTLNFIENMRKQFADKGFCYFAVDKLDSQKFIGFIGLSEKTFKADFTPCVDIGWRLSAREWNNGYATEGARKCLAYGFKELNIKKIYSIAPAINLKSQRVMKKIGMKKVKDFKHPLLLGDKRLQDCVLYEIENTR